MTTDDSEGAVRLDRFNANLAKVEELSQRLMKALAHRKQSDPALQGPSQDMFVKLGAAYWSEMMNNPARMIEQQALYWGKALKHFSEAQSVMAKASLPEESAAAKPAPKDRRFSNPLWDTNPYFSLLKQQYLMNAEAMTEAIAALDNIEPAEKKRIEYFARQIVDMMSPTNFFGTNPDALQKAVETDGMSLVQGLENLVRDIEANEGDLLVTLADRNAFQVGGNLATTPGSVVFRNKMFELIQYTPTTEKVYKTPLVIFPPWINKFYILDLKPQNSLIKWIVDQGFTLFVVSWVNPDASYADIGMDDYINQGYLAAINEIQAITKEPEVNAVGYCIAGTTLGLTLAKLKKEGKSPIKSATFFTTLTDFSEQGEFAPFLTDDFVDGIEREVKATGILSSVIMSRTFSFLRSNDLIYQPAIKSYMMGEAPPAFDLLFWNGDGTNLPGRMAVEYLRGLCQGDAFAKGKFTVGGEAVSLSDITVPVCAIACESDHIAAWKDSFRGVRKFGSRDKTFILSQSGHIAGIVNPPEKDKYGHYTNDAPMGSAEDWLEGATFTKGSWWPRWGEWLAGQSGAKVAARVPGDSSHPVLTPAPGSYAVARST